MSAATAHNSHSNEITGESNAAWCKYGLGPKRTHGQEPREAAAIAIEHRTLGGTTWKETNSNEREKRGKEVLTAT